MVTETSQFVIIDFYLILWIQMWEPYTDLNSYVCGDLWRNIMLILYLPYWLTLATTGRQATALNSPTVWYDTLTWYHPPDRFTIKTIFVGMGFP